jgi:hypothetical protein
MAYCMIKGRECGLYLHCGLYKKYLDDKYYRDVINKSNG